VAGTAAAGPGQLPLSRLRVRLTPSGGADRIDGRAADADGNAYLKARVRAAPEDGKANAALEALIAKAFGVAKSKVSVTRGATARMKTLEIHGASETEVAAFMARYQRTNPTTHSRGAAQPRARDP
jgi:uncharacterized protein YggU (UPF0235/DUF167 family)